MLRPEIFWRSPVHLMTAFASSISLQHMLPASAGIRFGSCGEAEKRGPVWRSHVLQPSA